MATEDVAAVQAIEQAVHAHPWTRGNFDDALASGYFCRIDRENEQVRGYIVVLPGVGEGELLTVGVAAECQRKGIGRTLLDDAMQSARAQGWQRLLLEVRPSNRAALALYRQYGFVEIGRRKGYYPSGTGREDAIIMEYGL
jgi:ribosomal-protein-alanine N-acetyltransferase